MADNLAILRSKPLRHVSRLDDTPRALLEFFSPSAGLIATPVTTLARGLACLMTGMVVLFLLVATFAPIDRVVTGSGILKPVVSTIVVQPYEQAIIRSIDVRPGDIVKPGQIIARLDPTISQARVDDLRKQADSYAAEVARLTAQAAGIDYHPDLSNPASTQQEAAFLERQAEFKARVTDYNQQIAAVQADLAGYDASAIAFAQRLKIAGDEQHMRLELEAQQVGSHLDSLVAMESVVDIQNQEALAITNANSARGKIASLAAQRDTLKRAGKVQVYADLTTARRKLDETRDQLTRADFRRKLVMFRASKPAVVVTIAPVSVGSVLQSGETFITLMPVDSAFEASVMVPSSEVGYIKRGDGVNVKFNTLPALFFGSASGTVANISADSFEMGGNGATVGTSLVGANVPGNTYYQLRVVITRYNFHNAPAAFRLTPGMPVTADVEVGHRTIMEYLLGNVAPK